MHILLNPLFKILASFNILLLIGASPAFIIDELGSVEKHCAESCSNNGICGVDDRDPACYCLPGWMGPHCEQVRPKTESQDIYARWSEFNERAMKKCPSNIPTGICQNGGSCYLIDNVGLTCLCSEDYTGEFCEVKSPCGKPGATDAYCQHGGTCIPNSDPEIPPKCECPDGYTGFDCRVTPMPTTPALTTPLNEGCKYAPTYCKNGGTCEPEGTDKLKCKCPPGFTGIRCEKSAGTSPSQTTPPVGPGQTTPPVGPGQTTPPVGPGQTTPPVGPGQTTPPIGPGQTTPPIGPGQTTPPVGPGQTTPPVGPGQTTPPVGPGQTTPPVGPGQTTPPVGPGQTNIPTGPAGITCANRPCQNNRPCYNTGASYICYCGPQYTGINCENLVG